MTPQRWLQRGVHVPRGVSERHRRPLPHRLLLTGEQQRLHGVPQWQVREHYRCGHVELQRAVLRGLRLRGGVEELHRIRVWPW